MSITRSNAIRSCPHPRLRPRPLPGGEVINAYIPNGKDDLEIVHGVARWGFGCLIPFSQGVALGFLMLAFQAEEMKAIMQ
jgi:hypothetical protein